MKAVLNVIVGSGSGLGAAVVGVVMPNYLKAIEPYSDYILIFGLCLMVGPWIFYGIMSVRHRRSMRLAPQWFTGASAVREFRIDNDQLRQCVLNGMPVYPGGDDVIRHPGEVPPLDVDDMFHFNNIEELRFKGKDLRRFLGR